jgi:G3E family GTPase
MDMERPEGADNECEAQIAFADKVLLNKIDLVTKEELADVERRIKKLNPTVAVIHTQHSKIDPARLLGLDSFSLERVLDYDPDFLKATDKTTEDLHAHHHHHHHDGSCTHDHDHSDGKCSHGEGGDHDHHSHDHSKGEEGKEKEGKKGHNHGVVSSVGWKSSKPVSKYLRLLMDRCI